EGRGTRRELGHEERPTRTPAPRPRPARARPPPSRRVRPGRVRRDGGRRSPRPL
ncbi:MAG: hypothetical protein AVDCRST_MAG54-1464, partial [uncultured Actinomycetospora sp.]